MSLFMYFLISFCLFVFFPPDVVLGKECTNTPTQLSSHTVQYELFKTNNLSWRDEMYELYHLTPTDDSTWANLRPRGNLIQYGSEDFNWEMLYRCLKNPGIATEKFLKEVSLHDVRLDPDSIHGRAAQTNLEYLLLLDEDSLVWSFRKTAKLSTPGKAYGGWEDPAVELRGHFVGHYLSASARMWASTHNDTLYQKMSNVVSALHECQEKIGTGYLSAFPDEQFDRVEAIKPVWAPYYTIHKIMSGLLDQYLFTGNNQTLRMVVWMAEYFSERVENVISKYTIERHWTSLNEESGGMNDVLYRLYTVTGDQKHLVLAHLFDKPCFLGLLAVQADSLSGFHSNTHIPVVLGSQMRYEVTGDPLYKAIGTYFMDIINSSHCYATGGTSVGEFWSDPKRLATTLEAENEESCTTYNMLKVSRNLFRWTKEMAYVDYYERALTNGVLSIQRGTEPGVMIYMLPLGRGQSKAHSYHGWGTQFDTFWCCYGTGIESFSKLGVSIYFEEDADVPGLYIIQYVSSSFNWKSGQIMLKQDVEPVISSDAQLRVSLSFSTKEGIDAEASALQKRLEGMKESREASDKGEARTLEALKETLAEVRLCSTLEALLLQKKNLYYGDSPEIHSEKVDKLKVLSESLANSTVKAEKRISDHRNQKEEALNFCLAKTNDVSEAEKELATEIAELDKKRDELEAELKKVNSSLTAARARLHNTKEEREQFDEASNQFLLHLKAKEDDLSRSVASGKVEADVVHIWINFLEDSWHSQSSYIEQKEKQTNHELKKYGNYFADLVTNHLSAYKEKLGTFLSCIRKSVDHLKKFNERAEMESSPDSDLSNQRKKLEEEYVEFEVKIITTFSVADNMKQQFYSQHGSNSRQDDPKVKELFDAIEQIKKGFECIERPTLEIETPSPKGEWPPEEKSHKGSNAIETIEMAQPDKEVSPKSASTWTVRQKWQHWSLNLGTPAKITCQETLETGSLMPSNRNRNPATPHQINSQNLLHPEEHPVI